MNTSSVKAAWSRTTRRFAGSLSVLMIVGFILSNAIVNAARSGLPFGTTLLANVLASFTWLLPWVAIVAGIGFLAAWGVLQLGRHRRGMIEWWRGGLAAFAAAILATTAHFGLNSWIDAFASVSYTGGGRASEAMTRMLVGIVFVIWSSGAGIVLADSCRDGTVKRFSLRRTPGP